MGRPKGSTNKGLPAKKERFLTLLKKHLGVVAPAVEESTEITMNLYYQWCNLDEEFAKRVEDIKNEQLDFVESQLFKQIKSGGAAQTIFYLKTKGKKRGYSEEQTLNLKPITINYVLPEDVTDPSEDKPPQDKDQ